MKKRIIVLWMLTFIIAILWMLTFIMRKSVVFFLIGCEENQPDVSIIVTHAPQSPPDDGDGDVESAVFAGSSPEDGGTIAANGSIVVRFDNNPGEVTASAGEVSGSGKSRNIKGPFDIGSLALTVEWTNGDGSQTINLTVEEADETAPEVKDSNPTDDAKDLDPAKVFEDGITVTFTEVVTGTLKLMDGDTDVGWTSAADGDTVTLIGNAGQELSYETEYTVVGTVADGAGNLSEIEITFTTKAKD